jgi:hypothetical protein
LYDIARAQGVPHLAPGDHIFPEDLEAWEESLRSSRNRLRSRQITAFGYRPITKNATINARSVRTGIIFANTLKAKGDHHARDVTKLDDNGRHCRCRRRHCGTYHHGSGSDTTRFRWRASSDNAEHALGRT